MKFNYRTSHKGRECTQAHLQGPPMWQTFFIFKYINKGGRRFTASPESTAIFNGTRGVGHKHLSLQLTENFFNELFYRMLFTISSLKKNSAYNKYWLYCLLVNLKIRELNVSSASHCLFKFILMNILKFSSCNFISFNA